MTKVVHSQSDYIFPTCLVDVHCSPNHLQVCRSFGCCCCKTLIAESAVVAGSVAVGAGAVYADVAGGVLLT